MSKLIDLTGQDFGYWHVLERERKYFMTEKEKLELKIEIIEDLLFNCFSFEFNLLEEKLDKNKLKQLYNKYYNILNKVGEETNEISN